MYNIDYISSTIDNSTFIETPDQVENKKCTINPQKKDNKCFQYSIAIFSCHKEIKKKNPERGAKVKPFINSFSWENTNFPPQEKDYQ